MFKSETETHFTVFEVFKHLCRKIPRKDLSLVGELCKAKWYNETTEFLIKVRQKEFNNEFFVLDYPISFFEEVREIVMANSTKKGRKGVKKKG